MDAPLIIGVDDEPDDIFFLRRALQKTGFPHRFQPFSNGHAAMAALTAVARKDPGAEVPLVCFLDIKMVGLSGFDILRWIRSQHELDLLPVLMFSSSDHPADVQMARDLGAQGYLKKHPSISAMQTVLEEAIRFAQAGSPQKTFLQWTHRFVDSSASGVAAS